MTKLKTLCRKINRSKARQAISAKRKIIRKKLRPIVKIIAGHTPNLFKTKEFAISAGAVIILMTILVGRLYIQNSHYNLSKAEVSLISSSSIDKKLIKQTAKDISYNRSDEVSPKDKSQQVTVTAKEDATGKVPYSAVLAKDPKKGITFSDSEGARSINLTPLSNSTAPKLNQEGQVVYPSGSNERHIYSFKKNGIKSDITLLKAPSQNTRDYSYKLSTGSELEARLMPDGGVGVYSANPLLFGNLQVSDDKSQKLVDNAKKNGTKDNLVFELPKPFIINSKGLKSYDDVNYILKDNVLTLQVRNLKNQLYPLTIDPTIIVTTTSDFGQNIGNTGNIDQSTANQINRGSIGIGEYSTFTSNTNYFTYQRTGHAIIAYNGYLYVIGGFEVTSDTNCKNSGTSQFCNDIQYASINPTTGAIGTFTTNTNYFSFPRAYHSAVVYNGYMYITGGQEAASDTNCKSSGTSDSCSDVQYAVINTSDGSVGTFTTSSNYFTARYGHATVAYNGYLYVTGGLSPGPSYLNDVRYAAINSDGSIGSFTTNANSFTTTRYNHASVVYNGYIYIVGGLESTSDTNCKNGGTSTSCNDIQYAQINSDGSTSTFTTTSYFSIPRSAHTSVAYNGYLYVIGGLEAASDTACKNSGTSTSCNDTQYAPINSNGSIGTFTTNTNYFTIPRSGHTAAIYSGFLYVVGGLEATSDTSCKDTGTNTYCNDIQYASRLPGSTGATTNNSNYFSVTRDFSTSVAYNGYLYMIGGVQGTSDTACKNSGTSTLCNDIQYALINSDGSTGSFNTASNYFNLPRYQHASVAYNGYLYIVGGGLGTSTNQCKNTGTSTYCSDIQFAAIGSNGDIGAFTLNKTYFSYPRIGQRSVAYNGFLYVTGGQEATSDTNCKNSGTNQYCNDIQYAAINTNGSIGSFTANTNYFNFARYAHTSAVYNGYLYLSGGFQANIDTNCKASGTSALCSDTQYLKIGSNNAGQGTFGLTSYFSFPRWGHAAVAYNGYLYIIGGQEVTSDTNCKNSGTSTYCNDIRYAAINADGSIGSFTLNTNYFNFPRFALTALAYNGYLYVMGGFEATSDTNCKNSGTNTYCNDIQYAQINSSTGAIGSFTLNNNYFSYPRAFHSSLAYNGNLYIIGGEEFTSDTNCKSSGTSAECNDIQYASINTSTGAIGSFTTNTNYFTTPRERQASIIYNGFLYVTAGCTTTLCGTVLGDIQYASVNSNGGIGTFTTNTTNYNSGRHGTTMIAYNNYLYIIGGSLQTLGGSTACKNAGSSDKCNDTQYAPINSDGSIGSFSISSNYFSYPRSNHGSVAYNGFLYVTGGIEPNVADTNCKNAGSNTYCNDVQYSAIKTQALKARYERFFDTGSASNIITSFVINGSNKCSYIVTYKTAGSNGIYGSATTLSYVFPGVTQSLNISSQRYVSFMVTLDDTTCGGQSTVTDITLTYNAAPDTPTLVLPSNGSTGVNVLPEFRMGTTDDSNDYLQYKIEVCTVSDCSSILRAIDQTGSQTGWKSQSLQTASAFSGGATLTQLGVHQYQTAALSGTTQYWWRAYAKDPGGSNQWSNASPIWSFTTASATPSVINIGGGTTIYSGTTIGGN